MRLDEWLRLPVRWRVCVQDMTTVFNDPVPDPKPAPRTESERA